MKITVEPMDWLRLRDKTPESFHYLIDMCYDLESLFALVNRLGLRIITRDRLMHLVDISQRILFEYLRLLSPEQDKVKSDLQSEYSLIFMGKEGFLMKYLFADEASKLKYLHAFLVQLHAFIHFRIYDSLVQIDIDDVVRDKFVKFSVAKTGVFEELFEEEEEGYGRRRM
ncbi:MAG TPA: hypothetical protein ENF58_02100 [Candidatus Altiarchaeales archaeon]|nr:hypothetical protein [Candidatus Altiarchaeales archaeon]